MSYEKHLISYKGMRRYLKHKLQGHIEKKAVVHLQNTIQLSLDDFCVEANKQHDEQNRLRKSLGLKEKKRFGEELFKNVSPRFLSQRTLLIVGEDGQQNGDTSSSGGNEQMKNKTCSKKAGCEVQ